MSDLSHIHTHIHYMCEMTCEYYNSHCEFCVIECAWDNMSASLPVLVSLCSHQLSEHMCLKSSNFVAFYFVSIF